LSQPGVAISGVSRGIGASLTAVFHNAGWRVVGFGRSRSASFAEIDSEFVECDMADPASVRAACGLVSGSLDVLICNAATFGPRAFHLHDFDPAAFGEAFHTNVVSPLVMAQSLYPHLDQGGRKLIVMMSTGNASLSGNVEGSMLAYRCSKSALNQAVRNLAAEWGPRGFTTVALNPGWVRTDMGGPAAPLSAEEAARAIHHFVSQLASPSLNGRFVNTDGSDLPW
jgi:NAD(P)-dependent dehydrogenase (short-subunit alcohol dehydrogenase family)